VVTNLTPDLQPYAPFIKGAIRFKSRIGNYRLSREDFEDLMQVGVLAVYEASQTGLNGEDVKKEIGRYIGRALREIRREGNIQYLSQKITPDGDLTLIDVLPSNDSGDGVDYEILYDAVRRMLPEDVFKKFEENLHSDGFRPGLNPIDIGEKRILFAVRYEGYRLCLLWNFGNHRGRYPPAARPLPEYKVFLIYEGYENDLRSEEIAEYAQVSWRTVQIYLQRSEIKARTNRELSQDRINEILNTAGKTVTDASRDLQFRENTVRRHRKNHRIESPTYMGRKLPATLIRRIRKDREEERSYTEISRQRGVSRQTAIKYGKSCNN